MKPFKEGSNEHFDVSLRDIYVIVFLWDLVARVLFVS